MNFLFSRLWSGSLALVALHAALVAAPAEGVRISDPADRVELEIALDELAFSSPGKGFRVEKVPPAKSVEALEKRARAVRGGSDAFLVFYPPNRQGDERSRRILTNRVTVQVAPGTDIHSLAAKLGGEVVSAPDYAPGFFILGTRGVGEAAELAEALRKNESVLLAEPLLARQRSRRTVANDPLAGLQWHIKNTGQSGGAAGIDANVSGVWPYFRGSGVVVAVVDDGVEYTHPDLAANCDASLGYDYALGISDPSPGLSTDPEGADSHGTAVAGIIAATGNNSIGVVGVAHEATLVPIRLLGAEVSDEQEAAALVHENQVVQISNNSWGGIDDGQSKGGAGPLVQQALRSGATTGRGGKGTVFVWAAGNGGTEADNANYDTYANSIYTIAVGALNDLGKKADYSEPGACVVVSAPGGREMEGREPGIVTTDLTADFGYNRADVANDLADTHYTANFNGTSAATPVVSGVVALMLEANPHLGWRDVQEILMLSATRHDPQDEGWQTNGGGLLFHHHYGSGLVNAEAAVATALDWRNLPEQTAISLTESGLSAAIPDNDAAGIVRSFDFSQSNLRVEHVEVTVTISHTFRGDLAISLISPGGMVSLLAEPHIDSNANYDAFTFMSVFHWAELSTGEWRVHIADLAAGDTGQLEAVQVQLYGTEPVAPQLTLVREGAANLFLLVDGHAGRANIIEASPDLVQWSPLETIYWPNGPYHVQLPWQERVRFYRVRIP